MVIVPSNIQIRIYEWYSLWCQTYLLQRLPVKRIVQSNFLE